MMHADLIDQDDLAGHLRARGFEIPAGATAEQACEAVVRGLTVVPLMPGGVGVSELAYVAMLTPIAGTQYVNQVTAGVLIYRILTSLLMIPAGAVALGLWQAGLRRAERERNRAQATEATEA